MAEGELEEGTTEAACKSSGAREILSGDVGAQVWIKGRNTVLTMTRPAATPLPYLLGFRISNFLCSESVARDQYGSSMVG